MILTVSKRHILKTISWRIIGSIDTFLLSWLITGNLMSGVKISSYELLTKMVLYYSHEQLWFKSKLKDANKRHVIKTITWRIIGTLDTIILGTLVAGNALIGLKVGGAETITKLFLYYIHEKVWYRLDYGLKNRNK